MGHPKGPLGWQIFWRTWRVLEQPSKAFSPTLTESGMAKVVKELQPAKAQYPILVTVSGSVRLVKELQLRKAQGSMAVADSGRVKLVKELQLQKVPA